MIKKHLRNLIKKLNPDPSTEDRIKEKVFARLNLEMPQKRHNLFDLITMNKKIIIGTLSMAAIGIFVGLPILMGATTHDLTTTGSSNLEKQQTNDMVIDENNYYEDTAAPAPSAGNVGKKVNDIVSEIFEEEDTKTNESKRAKEKWAELLLQVDAVSDTITQIYELTGSVDGYVISSDYSTGKESGEGAITIRVPSDRFDYAVKELRGYAVEVLSESTNIVDIQNEITTNENTLTELRKNLDDEYKKLEEAATESEKRNIENRIEQIENQIAIYEEEARELEQKASYSTIEITLTQEGKAGNEINDVFTRAWKTAKVILEFWARIAIWGVFIIPPVALPVLAFFAVKKLGRWLKNRKK